MKIPFSINDDDIDHPIVNLLNTTKIFYFLKLKELRQTHGKKIIFIKKNFSTKKIINLIESFKNEEFDEFFLLIHRSEQKIKNQKSIKVINYPKDIQRLLKEIFVEHNKSISFLNLSLTSKNILFNKDNKKTIYLTETEAAIVKSIFVEKAVQRETINKKILKLNPNVETKSLESHLSRIRKKIKEIDEDVEIATLGPVIKINRLL